MTRFSVFDFKGVLVSSRQGRGADTKPCVKINVVRSYEVPWE